jgi:cyd operon protein YbgT
MWYFSWILGLAMAVMFGILNAMWLENREAAKK